MAQKMMLAIRDQERRTADVLKVEP